MKKYIIAVCAALLLIYLSPLLTHPLFEPDEGRYAEIPREMIETGDYITPRLNYVKYFEKPVLLYWMNAASFKIFGMNEFAARFPCAALALAGIAAAALLGGYIFGGRAGLLSAVVLGTSLLYFAIGTINLTDMPVSCFITVAAASFYVAARSGNRRWYLLFYAATALAVLTKGLIGIILPGGVAFWYIVLTKKWRLAQDALYLPGIALFFIITVPWFYLVCKANPDFFRFFFIQEHFLRYATKMHGRYEPFWFFLPMIPAAILPWTGFALSLFGRGSVLRQPADKDAKDANVYLLLWFGVILLFFSLSSSKLVPYIVPCMPPLAILTAAAIDRMISRGEWGAPLAINAVTAALFSAALIGFAAANKYIEHTEAVLISIGIALPFAGANILAWRRSRTKSDFAKKTALLLCAGALLFSLALQGLYIPLGHTRSTRDVAELASKFAGEGVTIAVYGDILQGVPFYTRSRVALVNAVGELEYGMNEADGDERRKWFMDLDTFRARWDAGEPFVLIAEEKRLSELAVLERSKRGRRGAGQYEVMLNTRK
ncbi:glycosyl transferase [Synergistales bacterium]|nr:glycosyl transferase [Synergistales bacterium]